MTTTVNAVNRNYTNPEEGLIAFVIVVVYRSYTSSGVLSIFPPIFKSLQTPTDESFNS